MISSTQIIRTWKVRVVEGNEHEFTKVYQGLGLGSMV